MIKLQPVMCIASQWHHTEAPRPFTSKVGVAGFAGFAQIMYILEIPKIDVLSTPCIQMRSWLVKLIKLQPVMCIASQWHHTEAPRPFTSKVGVARFANFAQICINQKS